MKRRILDSVVSLSLFLSVLGGVFWGCTRSAEFKDSDSAYRSDSKEPYDFEDSGTVSGQPRKKVWVLPFWNDTPIDYADVEKLSADELKRGLFLSKKVLVLRPQEEGQPRKTADFVNGEKVKIAQLVADARARGVSAVMIGRVSELAFRSTQDEVGLFKQKELKASAQVEIKIYDVTSGKELGSFGKIGRAQASTRVAVDEESLESRNFRSELLGRAVSSAVRDLTRDCVKVVEKLTWQGRIFKISGRRLYINSGKSAGIMVGDILKVFTAGEDLYDPQTGAYLGRSPGQLKGTLEVRDLIGEESAVSEVHTGGNFGEGDVVQLY